MSSIKICALSDIHGKPPNPTSIDPVDVVVICGDTVPLEYQRSNELTEEWFGTEFKDWVKCLRCDRVVIIAGNHDFWMFSKEKEYIKSKFREWCPSKVVYLQDELYGYNGVTFYGCPWCQGPLNWAFCPGNKYKSITSITPYYEQIPECELLLTHQPPKIGDLGVSFYWDPVYKADWSSDDLRLNIKDKNILVNFCGHVHSGKHERIEYPVLGCDTIFYNVSILNERYITEYDPRYIQIDTERKTIIELGHSSIEKEI